MIENPKDPVKDLLHKILTEELTIPEINERMSFLGYQQLEELRRHLIHVREIRGLNEYILTLINTNQAKISDDLNKLPPLG